MAYTATVTLDHERAERISRNFGMIVGKCVINNYNQTLVEITGITKFFRKAPRVIVDGFSSGGFLVRWNTTSKAFSAFFPKKATTSTVTIGASSTVADANNTLIKKTATGIEVAGTGTACTAVISGQDAAAGTQVGDNNTAVGEVNFIAVGLI